MIAALIACILVLGFNYWVSSSRNLELQTKVYELEGQVRRGAAEREATELKRSEFEDEIQKQKAQINHIEMVYQRKLEEAQDTCSQVKATLQQNVSSSTTIILQLKGQLNQLNDDVEKLQNELLSCQGSVDTLNNKLTFDMTHCQSQVQSQKELCDERVAAAKLEVQNDMEKRALAVSPQQDNANTAGKKDGSPTNASPDRGNVTSAPAVLEQKGDTGAEPLSNDINTDKDVTVSKDPVPTKDLSPVDSRPGTTKAEKGVLEPQEGAAATETGANLQDKNQTEGKELEVMDAQEEEEVEEEDDPGMEGMLIQGKDDGTRIDQKIEEPEEYDADEPVIGGGDLEKQQQDKKAENKGMGEEKANYNGDDDNEGEFEADKQAELSEI